MIKRQLIFDTVARHLLTQGTRAVTEYGRACRYRGPDNTKCAIGALIPDDIYSDHLEGGGVHALLCEPINNFVPENIPYIERFRTWFKNVYGKPNEFDMRFLSDLQTIHDSESFDIDEWPLAIAALAGKYGLNWRVVPRTLKKLEGQNHA